MKKLIVILLIAFPLAMSAQMTYIPDDNFEQALIDLGYDKGPLNDSIPTANIDTVTYLDIGLKNIKDLTGIEDFRALEYLYCYSNELTSLVLSNNRDLILLDCSFNHITELDISGNLLLATLRCHSNDLSSLVVSNNRDLFELSCHSNKLMNLVLTNNPFLGILHCSYNLFESMDVSKNTNLIEYNCHSNEITSLDLSHNIGLKYLLCSYNMLTNLDVSRNNELQFFVATNNPNLTCIQVIDSYKASKNTLWHKDDWAVYSEDCSTVGVDEDRIEYDDISISPNPASDYIEINYNVGADLGLPKTSDLKIYNSLGECVLTPLAFGEGTGVRLDISPLPPGVYFIRINSGEEILTSSFLVAR
jgi:hypothetical protein